jgi:HEPN domain-containing protein
MMPPASPRDFMRAGEQRLTAAEELFRAKQTLDAQYLGGYMVECALKALILHRTPEPERADQLKRITSGAVMHRPEVLIDELRKLGERLPLDLVKRVRRCGWTTDLRYETGKRDTGETTWFLKTVKAVADWVEEKLT